MHNQILAFAAHEFATKGYKNTHVTTIMRRLGITATVFYSHFPSKRQAARRMRHHPDELEHQVRGRRAGRDRGPRRTAAMEHLRALAGVRARLRGLGRHPSRGNGRRRRVSQSRSRRASRRPSTTFWPTSTRSSPSIRIRRRFRGELIALNLFGAYEHVAFRSRFDKEYSRKELLRGPPVALPCRPGRPQRRDRHRLTSRPLRGSDRRAFVGDAAAAT